MMTGYSLLKKYPTGGVPQSGYDKWRASLPTRLQNTSDYDLQGYYNKYGPVKIVGDQHLTDEFKLPNHVTFSNESKYSNQQHQGGQWSQDATGKWSFAPSQWNINNVGADSLQSYFKEAEPNSKLNLPQQPQSKYNLPTYQPQNPVMQQDATKVVQQFSDGGEVMTGYNKIKKRTSLPRYGYGRSLPKYAMGDDDPSGAGDDSNFFDDNSKAITGAGNFLGDTIGAFNKGGTGTGSVVLGAASSTLKGAAEGTAILPGIGTAVGAGIGLVSGIVGGEAKQKAAIRAQRLQQGLQGEAAANRSNSVVRGYDNQGVQNAQLYAEGGQPYKAGVVNAGNIIGSVIPTTSNPLLTEHSDGTYRQWGESGTSKPAFKSLPSSTSPKLLSDKTLGYSNNYYPSNSNRTTPTPDTIKSSYATGGFPRKFHGKLDPNVEVPNFPLMEDGGEIDDSYYAEGGSIHINPANKGKFTAYKQRTGQTTTEALHSKNPHVRQMANFARNAKKFKHADGGELGVDNPDYLVDPSYEAEGGETVQGNDAQIQQGQQLASNMQQFQGPSHEQGGVDGSGGDRIYSDRLLSSPELRNVLRTSGFKFGEKDSYAKISAKLGRLQGKFEGKSDGVGKQTANVMLPRIQQALDDTFNDQEAGKAYQQKQSFANGGAIGGGAMKYGLQGMSLVYAGGGPVDDESLNVYRSDVTNPDVNTQDADMTKGVSATPFDWNPQGTPAPQQQSFLQKATGFIDENSGQLGNLGNYAANLGTIGRLNTTVNPNLVATPNYNYVDRSGSALSKNNALFKTGIRSLTNSGQTVNASNVASLYAKTLEGNSNVVANENLRKDQYQNQYNERADKTNDINTGITNKALEDSRDLYNQKIALQLQARNAFQQGIVGNKTAKDNADLEQKKLLTVLAANDQNGVMTRFLQNYPRYKKLLDQYNSTSN